MLEETSVLPRSVLVTGSGGFIGGHVIDALLHAAPAGRVVALDRPGREHPRATAQVACELAGRGDDLAEIIRQYDVEAVVHCAGSAGSSPDQLTRDNVGTVSVLLDMASHLGRPLVICHLGSSAEYQPLDRPAKTGESAAESPVGAYGRAKLEATRAVLGAASPQGPCAYVLRVFNPIGAGMPESNLAGRVCAWLRADTGEPLRVGNLDSYRDYIDVRDVANAVVASLSRASALSGLVVNVGSGLAHQTRDLVKTLAAFSKRPFAIEETATGSQRSGSVAWQEADISRARRLLSWEPRVEFVPMLERVAAECQRPRRIQSQR